MAGLVQYNFTIDDTSPVLTYSPYADFQSTTGQGDGLQNGWQTWYSGSGYLSSSDGPVPKGESFHLTSLPSASVSLSFYGTGVVLYGLANCSYDVEFDGGLMPNTTLKQGVFFSMLDAEQGNHNVSLIAKPDNGDQVLSFNGALVSSVISANGTSSPTTLSIDNQNTSAISYSGLWTPSKTISGIPSSGAAAPFHSTTASGASASLNFTGRAVALYGSSTTNHGQYSVTLDGVRQVFNGSSQWLLGNMLLFYQDGLDENSTHSLDLTNLNDGTALSLNSVEVTQLDGSSNSANGDSASGSLRVGAVVGPIIAFVVLASVLGLYFWTKRRDKRNPDLKGQEPRSSIASSIFLPQSFRRKYHKREDSITPYILEFGRSSNADTRSSVASSSRNFARWYEDERAHDEKRTDIRPTARSQEETLPAIPVTHLPGENDQLRSDSARFPNPPPEPANPPPAFLPITTDSRRVSPMRSDDPALIERVMELVSHRIDPRTSPANIPRSDSSDRLPSYPGSVV